MPPTLARSIRMSFGHFRRGSGSSASAKPAIASCAATAATNDRCCRWPGAQSGASSSVAARLPAGISQCRPSRPRPADWRRVVIQSGPRSPAAARRCASALVESTSSSSTRRNPSFDGKRDAGTLDAVPQYLNASAARAAASTSGEGTITNSSTKAPATAITTQVRERTGRNAGLASSKNMILTMRR